MGFEVTYHFRESIGPGQYSEEVQTKTVKVGTATEDTPLEAVASKVMAQLARRNILITDVEIYEYTRKKLTYKEADDGIIIKNKKFRFDDGPVASASPVDEDTPESTLAALLAANPNLLATLQQAAHPQPIATHAAHGAPAQPVKQLSRSVIQTPTGLVRARRWEVFSPELMLEHKAKQANLKLTKGKQYPIFEEEQIGKPPLTRTRYKTQDDAGRQVTVDAEYFVPPISGKLSHEDEMVSMAGAPQGDDVDLWGRYQNNESLDQMPDIGRR
jgi:hypothetical protein